MPILLCVVALGVLAVAGAACGGDGENAKLPLPEAPAGIRVTSTSFAAGGTIPTRFTCDGEGDSPQLSWSGVPARAKDLALVVDDPTAGHFVHWSVLDIAPSVRSVRADEEPEGGTETKNSAGDDGWAPPCPPGGSGVHEYVFAVYATDAPLGLGEDASPDEVRTALADHAIARGLLTGRFRRD
jgi:Raf kinase inhibitor-like YbhB/YbcL family protein